MTVKYIAFDGQEFDNEKRCKDYERENNAKVRTEIANARHALRRLDDFCKTWSEQFHYDCSRCPLIYLCVNISGEFEKYFNKHNPFGNIDVDGTLIEED